jgi:poly-gamma-glutamate capsule biosynthesis protein CapA/YwtB (metallophosphatase superfamily)
VGSLYTRVMDKTQSSLFKQLGTLVTLSLLTTLAGAQIPAAEKQVTLLVGGDVQWSLSLRPPTVLFTTPDPKDPDWRAVPYLNGGASKAEWQSLQLAAPKTDSKHKSIEYGLHFASQREMIDYPLAKLAPTFHSADIVFLNLETPLSDTAPMSGLSRTPEAFAGALSRAGVSLVTIANNHTFDTQTSGFLDTLRSLSAARMPFIGGGQNLTEARKPVILQRNGTRIGFLGYAQFSNMGEPAFAAEKRAGIAPMDPVLMKEDIRKLRTQVDIVAVSVHWGKDKSARVSPANRKLAHELIDAGADIILGSHTPFPKGIEIYRGKTIIYSPSHVAIAHNYADWGDNDLIRLTLGRNAVQQIVILPIAGKGTELAQPYLLHGDEAHEVLTSIQARSAELDTKVSILGDEGVINIP